MIYSLFKSFDFNIPGARLWDYITFRSGVAFVLALLIAIFIGSRIIDALRRHQIGESIRQLGLEGESTKKGTPTMGGIIIIIAILVPCLLVGNLTNTYMLMMLLSTVLLGSIGFIDDYKKIKYRNKDGLAGKYKIIAQVGVGLMVGLTMYLSPGMVITQNIAEVRNPDTNEIETVIYENVPTKTPQTTIPFVKNNNFDYTWLTEWMGDDYAQVGGWIVFVLISIFFVTATSNGANLTDGLDGLACGISAINGVALAIMAYLGGNLIYSSYLNIMYIPQSGEMVVYMAAFIGALIGFLWYNCAPAQVFMGDTGSLTLGGIIACFAILIHKELMLPLLCALFYLEDFSVAVQSTWFKFTRKKYGQGRRILKMAPLHHHFQKDGGTIEALIQQPMVGWKETKITVRFWIIAIILAAATFVTLKIR